MPYKSPFEPDLLRRGAVLGALGEIGIALHYGDPDRETGALRAGAGLVDLAWRGVVEVTGRDRVRFLHGMCTNDIKRLQPGQGCMAAVVNRQGKMVSEMIVHAAENALFLEMDRSNLVPTVDHLSKFLVADDVTLRVSDAAVLGLWGPRAPSLLSVGDLPDFHFRMREGVAISRNRTIGAEGYHLIVPAGKADEAEHLLAHGVAPAGFEACEALRIDFGFPRWGADMDATLLPMEAGLETLAISYAKGCYIGQEVIQRVKTYSEPPRMLVQLEATNTSAGDRVTLGADEVGIVTSAARSMALALVRKECKSPGTELRIGEKPAAVRALPWQSRLL